MVYSNEFQFFWPEGPLDWVSWLCLRSFTRYEGVTVQLYSYDPDLNPKIPGCVCQDANDCLPREIFEQVRSGYEKAYGEGYTEAADLFRYKLLYEKGGWYFDTDCLLLKPLTPLLDRDYVFGWEIPNRISIATLKFPKGHALLDEIYNELVGSDPSTRPQGTIPLFTKYLKRFGLIGQALPRSYFCPISPIIEEQETVPAEETSYILHLFRSLKRYYFDQSREIKLLERQVEELNKSLTLRIARRIPFGKQIRRILVNE